MYWYIHYTITNAEIYHKPTFIIKIKSIKLFHRKRNQTPILFQLLKKIVIVYILCLELIYFFLIFIRFINRKLFLCLELIYFLIYIRFINRKLILVVWILKNIKSITSCFTSLLILNSFYEFFKWIQTFWYNFHFDKKRQRIFIQVLFLWIHDCAYKHSNIIENLRWRCCFFHGTRYTNNFIFFIVN